MRSPKDFFVPLAIGAPEPLRHIPVPPSRTIHFFDPSNEMQNDASVKQCRVVAELADALASDDSGLYQTYADASAAEVTDA